MRYCTSCGKQLNDNAKFCTACGKKCMEVPDEDKQSVAIAQQSWELEERPVVESVSQEEASPAEDAVPVEEVEQKIEGPVVEQRQFGVKDEQERHCEIADREQLSEDLKQEQHNEAVEKEQTNGNTEYQTNVKASVTNSKIILFSILGGAVVLAVIVTVLLLRWYTSTEQQVLRAFDSRDYDAAIALMDADATANESETLAKQLKERIADIQQEFIDASSDYTTAKMELDTIAKFNVEAVSDELNAAQSFVDALNESRANFVAAEAFYTAGDYAEAITNYRLVIEDDVNYVAAVEKISLAVDAYREEILEKAKEFAEKELYTEAITLMNGVLKIIPDDSKIMAELRIYEKDNAEKLKADALKKAAEYAEAQEYLNAIKALEGVIKSQSTDAELVSAYNKYCNQYVAQIIEEVDAKLSNKDFNGAISVLTEAANKLPKCVAISEKLKETTLSRELSTATYFNGHYYKLYTGQATWDAAEVFCISVGGQLATITTKEENAFLYNYIVSQGLDGAYFGLSDAKTEGKWLWVTGEEVIYTNWAAGEPNSESGKEDYASFYKKFTDGKWNDGSYGGTNVYFICEWE